MSSFLDDLAAKAAERDEHGQTRRLVVEPSGLLLDLAGDDYLGLRLAPTIQAGAIAAIEDFGVGAGASRLVTGTMAIHAELEEALAEHLGADSALVFSSGYQANVGALTALADAGTTILSDEHNHASLIDGARLARGHVEIFAHGDLEQVEKLLGARTRPRAIVVVEAVFGVLGDAAPLAELVDLTERHDATLLVDEGHAVGVCGRHGSGRLAELGLAGRDHVVVTTSLAKALAAQGGAVLGHRAVREHLINTSRAFIFDTGLAPASAGGALAVLDLLQEEPDLPLRARRHITRLAEACGLEAPPGPILSVPMPGPREMLSAVDIAAAHGLRVGAFRPPATPQGNALIRVTAHAGHSGPDVEHSAKVLAEVTSRG